MCIRDREFTDGIIGLGLPLEKEQFAHIDGAPSPTHPPQSYVQLYAYGVHALRMPCECMYAYGVLVLQHALCDLPPATTGLFTMLDADGSGSINYRELNRTLRKDDQQAGAAGGVARNKSPLRKRSGTCLLYTSPSPRDGLLSRMPSSA